MLMHWGVKKISLYFKQVQANGYNQYELILTLEKVPNLLSDVIFVPITLATICGGTAFLLPPESESKLDLMINMILVMSVYMLILAEEIPSYTAEDQPVVGLYCKTV